MSLVRMSVSGQHNSGSTTLSSPRHYLSCNRLTHISRGVRASSARSDIRGHAAPFYSCGDGSLNRLSLFFEIKRVSQHQRDAEDRADRISNAAARNVRGGAVDWLV